MDRWTDRYMNEHQNWPPWLEKTLISTCLKRLKMHLNLETTCILTFLTFNGGQKLKQSQYTGFYRTNTQNTGNY